MSIRVNFYLIINWCRVDFYVNFNILPSGQVKAGQGQGHPKGFRQSHLGHEEGPRAA